jgi:4-amino-4-deoxy-L-arabinose transferase-like glycosyltransferase
MGIKRRDIIIVGIISLAVFRFALVINPLIEPDRGITVDSEQYLSLAQSIIDYQSYESPEFPQIDLFRAPGYPVFLALILWLTGGSLTAVLLLQMLLGLTCALLLYMLGKGLVDERVGLAGSILFLLSPNALLWSATIMTEILFATGLFLTFLLMWKIVKEEFPAWPVGILLGVLTLIRPIGLYLMLLFGVWLLFQSLQKSTRTPARRQLAGFLLACLLVVIPWFLRNNQKHGELTLSTVSGTTIRSFHLALSLVIIRSYPGAFIKVQIRGIARTVLGTEVGTWMELISDGPYEGSGFLNALLSGNLSTIKESISNLVNTNSSSAILLLAWGILYTVVISISSLIGFFRMMRYGDRELKYLGILILVTMLYLVLTPGAAGEARFRVPVEPMLAFFSAMVFLPKPVTNLMNQD